MTIKMLVSYLIQDNLNRRKFMKSSNTILGQISGFFSPNMIATTIMRLSHYFFTKRLSLISKLFYVMNLVLFGCDISPMSEIGPGFVMLHLVGNSIHAKIGKNALLFGQNGIGGEGGNDDKGWYGGPIIGDNLKMYHCAKILAPVEIGNNVVVGAMSLVLDPVPDNKVVVGIPARVVIKENVLGS